MKFNIQNFIAKVKETNNSNYNYGNEILYSAFNFNKNILPAPGSIFDTRFSSAMSIIGKSYSADPTRSAPKGVFSNNGTGNAFDIIADKVFYHKDYSKLYTMVHKLSSEKYNYDDFDKYILIETIDCVELLNEIIKDAMKGTENDCSHNVISFCSKFLHFLCPQVVFIIDSLSLAGGVTLLSGKTDRCLFALDIDSNARKIINENVELCKLDLSKYKGKTVEVYSKHVVRAYSIAAFLNKNSIVGCRQITSDPSSTYMTRLVDSILINMR